eukprot:575202-Amphidinium_carterae.2
MGVYGRNTGGWQVNNYVADGEEHEPDHTSGPGSEMALTIHTEALAHTLLTDMGMTASCSVMCKWYRQNWSERVRSARNVLSLNIASSMHV